MSCFVAREQRGASVCSEGERQGKGPRVGSGGQTKAAAEGRCRDEASAFTQEGGHEKGWEPWGVGWGGGGSVSDGELQPTHRAHAHAHIQTLWGKLTASHKSLSLTAVSD